MTTRDEIALRAEATERVRALNRACLSADWTALIRDQMKAIEAEAKAARLRKAVELAVRWPANTVLHTGPGSVADTTWDSASLLAAALDDEVSDETLTTISEKLHSRGA